jgi:hypothetical protein
MRSDLTLGIIMNVDDGCEPAEEEKAAAGGGRKKRPVADEELFVQQKLLV